MAKPTMSQQEKEWQAERDANTLINAEAISSDPSRINLAKSKIESMKQDHIKQLGAISTVSKKLSTKSMPAKDKSKTVKSKIKSIMKPGSKLKKAK